MSAPNASPLAGQVAVVTGASSGIGRAVARSLMRCGVWVCLVGRREPALAEVAASEPDHTAHTSCYTADLAVDDQVDGLVEAIRRDHGTLSILVHSAGAYSFGTISTTPVAEFDHVFRVNLRAPFVLTQQLLPLMTPERGQVVFINSTAGLHTRPGVGAYAASKWALRALADSLRAEVPPSAIRVSTVYPGRTATPMQERVHALEGREYHPNTLLAPEDVAERVVELLSLPTHVEVVEISLRPRSPTDVDSED